jgi:hypothetical protein
MYIYTMLKAIREECFAPCWRLLQPTMIAVCLLIQSPTKHSHVDWLGFRISQDRNASCLHHLLVFGLGVEILRRLAKLGQNCLAWFSDVAVQKCVVLPPSPSCV